MKAKQIGLLLMLLFFSIACDSQNDKTLDSETATTIDSLNQPEEHWKVNKEYDENGNIVRYDSIYSWSSSGATTDAQSKRIDSLMQSYRSMISKRFSMTDENDMSQFFLTDSLFPKGFDSDQFFDQHFNKSFMNMEDIRKRMEETRKQMLQQFFPNGINRKKIEIEEEPKTI